MEGCQKLKYVGKLGRHRIYTAKCIYCGTFLSNHRSYNAHKKICPRTLVGSQKKIDSFQEKTSNKEVKKVEIIPDFLKRLIEMIIGTNISISQVGEPYFIELFTFLNVKKEDLPTPYKLRKAIQLYSDEIYSKTYAHLKNKIVSLIVDGTTSWSMQYYEFAVFTPGTIKHIKILHIPISDAICLKKAILNVISSLEQKGVTVVGICTDNGPNLKSACEQITDDYKKGLHKIPLLRFACAAHTGQLLIKDMEFSGTFYSKISRQTRVLVKWLKKQKIRSFSQTILSKRPPTFSEIRWNTLYFCITFIYENYDAIGNIIEHFKYTKNDSKQDLHNRDDYLEVINVLKPIHDFTCIVEANFCTTGKAFKALLDLKDELKHLIPSRSSIAEKLLTNVEYRFSNTCDSLVAQLSYILTNEGRSWWKAQKSKNEEILRKITAMMEISEEEHQFIQEYHENKEDLHKKIENLSTYLNLNSKHAMIAFFDYLKNGSEFYEPAYDYWETQAGLEFTHEEETIRRFDIAQIALRVLVLPSSEALCERVFSQLKYFHNARRSMLKPDIIDSITNIRFEMKMNNQLVKDSDEIEEYDIDDNT